jgi:hypothetical protein
MSEVLEPQKTADAAVELVANRFTPDAQERTQRLRAMAAEFPDESDPRPLTPGEMSISRQTRPAALEKAAVFAEATPGVSGTIADVADLRDAIAFELAYSGVRDEARSFARRVDMAILRRKLKAVKTARGLYRIAKGFVTMDAGDSVRTHVADLKRTLVVRHRKKTAAPPEIDPKQ